ncbi:MAG TPA: alkaline phosphatase family protein [Actinomycetes bacterium]|nr:alkaline phosphatase family protein [Actinomycetes bacterium]
MNARRWLGLALLAALVAAALILPEALEARERPARHPLARVILVVEENHEYRQIVGSRQAPFLNWLAAGGVLLTRYYAVTHPSLPNYMTLLAGDPLGIHGDCYACHRPGRNLVDQLQAAGISWKAYYQGLPAPCSTVAKVGAYASKVNPFLHLDDVRHSAVRCHRVVPLTQLAADLRGGRLPRFAVVTPDLRHDMHSGTVASADAFLRRLYRELARSPAWRAGTVLVVTFDEGSSSRGLHGHGGGHVATIVAGPGIPAGLRDPTRYDHYALLRSIERRFGLQPLRHAADPGTATIPAVAGTIHVPRRLA